MIKYFFQNVLYNLKKQKLSYVCIFLLLVLLFYSLGGIYANQKKAAQKEDDVATRISDKNIYTTSEWVGDILFYRYNREDELYQKMKKFIYQLQSADCFTYVTQIGHQGIRVKSVTIPDIFLMYYEVGACEYNIDEDEQGTVYHVKALHVSQSFFEKNQIGIDEGRGFTDEDYIIQSEEAIPVLLGSDYRDVFRVGDLFYGEFFACDNQFEVIGFLEEESFFTSKNQIEPESTRRYMITPAFLECDGCNYARNLMLQETVGLIYSSDTFENVIKAYNSIKEEVGIEDFEIYVNSPDNVYDYDSEMQTYIYMTKEITEKYRMLFWAVFFLVVITFYLVVRQTMEDNKYRYAVMMLNGASNRWIIVEIICQISILVFSAIIIVNFLLSLLINVYDQIVIQNCKRMLLGVALLLILLEGVTLSVYFARTKVNEVTNRK